MTLSDYDEIHAFGEIYESILRELQSAGSAGEYYTPRSVTDFMAQIIQPKIGEQMADFACGTGGFLTSWLKELEPQIRTTDDRTAYSNSVYGIEKKQFPYILCITNMLLHDLDVPQVYHGNFLLRNILDYVESDRFDVVLMNPPYGGNEKADVKNHFPADLASSETADLFMSVIMYRLKKSGRAAVILPDGWFYRLDMPEGYKNFSKTKPMKLEHFTPVVDWWNHCEEITVDGFDKAKKYTADELQTRNYNLDLCGYPHEEEEILPPKELIQQYQEKRASLNADIDQILARITDILGIDLTEDDG